MHWIGLFAIVCAGCSDAMPLGGTADLRAPDGASALDLARAACTPSCPAIVGNTCVGGAIHHFTPDDDTLLGASETVHVAVYDPLDLLRDPSAASPLAEHDVIGPCYQFPSLPWPSFGQLALAVSDAAGAPQRKLAVAVTGLSGGSGQMYLLDGYALALTTVEQWSSDAGTDYDAVGASVAMFFLDASHAPQNDFSFYETTPAAGVASAAAQDGGSSPNDARYLGATRGEVDPGLTATSAIGAALVPPNGFTTYGGANMTWDVHAGGSAPHLVVFDRLHPQ